MVGLTERGGSLEKKKYTFSSKNNATKEIESWGRDYGSLAEGSMRSAGQLTENVTEARMLQSRIMEMSRDRYKYVSQADFNKKFFLNAQQKKTKIMPSLLHGIDVEAWLSKKTARHVPQFSSSSASNARFAFLDRLEKQGEKCKDFEEDENPFDMPSAKPIPQQPNLPEFYRIRLQEQQEAEMAKTTFPTQPLLKPQTAAPNAVAFCDKKQIKLPEVSSSLTPSANQMTQRSKTMGLTPTPPAHKEQLRRVKSSISSTKSVEDPRYRTLESSLSGKYSKPEERDPTHVQSIINAHDSLYIPSKQAANSRPKVQKTILEYLRARGFDV